MTQKGGRAPDKPWHQVFEKYFGQIGAKIAEFDTQLVNAVQPFEN